MAELPPDTVDFIYLMESAPYDRANTVVRNEYLATRPHFFDANDATAPNRVYRGWVAQALTVRRSALGKELLPGGPALPTLAAVRLDVGDEFAARRALHKGYAWRGRAVQILRGTPGMARADFQLLLDGVHSGEPTFGKTTASYPISDLSHRLSKRFKDATYDGSGGFNGGADMKGQYRPDAVGYVHGAEGKWVDTANGWADYCASGFHSVSAVTDGASVLVADVSNPPAAGKYYVDAANGRIRYGSPPTYKYRVDFRSAFASNATTMGAIIKEALTARGGYSAGQIYDAAFTALDTDRPEKVGWYARDGETLQDLVDYMLSRSLCYLTAEPSLDGKLTVGELRPPTATAKTDAQVQLVITDRIIVPDSFRRINKEPPPRIDVLAQKNWCVLGDNELAAGATTANKDFARQEWRTIPKSNATTATEFPLSDPLEIQTPFTDITEAEAWADEVDDFLTVPQPIAECTLAVPPFALPMGAEVWIDSEINEVNGAAVVVDLDENAQQHLVKLRFYGLTEV
ncbi:MAG: hypothetical protein AB7I36_08235 [Rhodospirillaceae bacterium]